MTTTDNPAFQRAWTAVAGVDGWMTEGQASTLFDAATNCPPGGRIVEIGSFQGRSTIVLATAAPDGATVYAIDPHAGNDRGPQEIEGFEEAANADHIAFNANLASAGVAERVTHLRAFSNDALAMIDDAPIDVLYIDGAHRFAPARDDIRQWGAKVADGGTLLIHDSFSSIGVTLAIVAELFAGTRFRYVGRSRSMTIYRAVRPRLSPAQRLSNLGRQALQLPWFVRNVALKVALTLGLGKVMRRFGRPAPEWPY